MAPERRVLAEYQHFRRALARAKTRILVGMSFLL
jgi:hypothetical protein